MLVTKMSSSFIDKIIASCPRQVDLRDADNSQSILKKSEELLEAYDSLEKLEALEDELIARKDAGLIFVLLALKIARSKRIIRNIKKPFKLTIVFAVYKEHRRIRKKSLDPYGEDFLLRKAAQLEYLLGDKDTIDWELLLVDDGCPGNSGKIAQEILDTHGLGHRVKVLFLADAIQQKLPPAKELNSTQESQKGGSIVYGMWQAVQKSNTKDHVVVYTDADLSTHLGQLGLLLEPILQGGKMAAIGSRRESNSVVIKKSVRNERGKLFIYLWQNLLSPLKDIAIIDTQCGFKAFRGDIVSKITENLIEKKFAFDIELLLKITLIDNAHNSIAKVPIAWIDSEAASTTRELDPYLAMLQAIVKMYKKYCALNPMSDEFAVFINTLGESDFNKLVHNLPMAIRDREAHEYAAIPDDEKIGPDDLLKCIHSKAV